MHESGSSLAGSLAEEEQRPTRLNVSVLVSPHTGVHVSPIDSTTSGCPSVVMGGRRVSAVFPEQKGAAPPRGTETRQQAERSILPVAEHAPWAPAAIIVMMSR